MAKPIDRLPQQSSSSATRGLARSGIRHSVSLFSGQYCDCSGHRRDIREAIPAASVVSDWGTKMWKPIAPFVWEPIVALYPIHSVALFISVPNVLLALLLGTLVALNMAVAVARAKLVVAMKKSGGFVSSFLASLPALITGFACCVPTVILALGSLAAAFTVAAIAIAPYFLPLAALALIGNLVWGLRQYSCALPPAGSKVAVKQNRSKHIGDVKLRLKEKEG